MQDMSSVFLKSMSLSKVTSPFTLSTDFIIKGLYPIFRANKKELFSLSITYFMPVEEPTLTIVMYPLAPFFDKITVFFASVIFLPSF